MENKWNYGTLGSGSNFGVTGGVNTSFLKFFKSEIEFEFPSESWNPEHLALGLTHPMNLVGILLLYFYEIFVCFILRLLIENFPKQNGSFRNQVENFLHQIEMFTIKIENFLNQIEKFFKSYWTFSSSNWQLFESNRKFSESNWKILKSNWEFSKSDCEFPKLDCLGKFSIGFVK